MASHDLEHQPQERLITEIADLKKQLSELRTLQAQGTAAVNMQATGVLSSSLALTNGAAGIFIFSLASTEAKMIFSTFSYTLYQGASASNATAIGHDTNVFGYGWIWRHWTDWQAMSNEHLTKGYTSQEYIWVENHTGATQTITVLGEWRYVVNGGTVAVG